MLWCSPCSSAAGNRVQSSLWGSQGFFSFAVVLTHPCCAQRSRSVDLRHKMHVQSRGHQGSSSQPQYSGVFLGCGRGHVGSLCQLCDCGRLLMCISCICARAVVQLGPGGTPMSTGTHRNSGRGAELGVGPRRLGRRWWVGLGGNQQSLSWCPGPSCDFPFVDPDPTGSG